MREQSFDDTFIEARCACCFSFFVSSDIPQSDTMRAPTSRTLSVKILLGVLFWYGASIAQCVAEPMTLENALASAYLSNPQLDAQRAALRATDEEVAKALAGWRPTVGVTGGYGWQQEKETLLGPQTTQSNPQSDQLTVSQPVYDGRTVPNVEHAKALVEAGRAQLLDTEQTVLLNATTAYFAVLRDTKIIDAYHEDIERLRTIQKNVQRRVALGELTKTDESQASARLVGSELNLAAEEQQLTSDQQAFAHAVGKPAETLSEHSLPALPQDDKSLDLALGGNPKLLQTKAQAQAADYAVGTAFGALFPSLSVQAQYGRTVDEIAPGIRENGISVIGQLNIPLYQGGAEEAAVREAKEQSGQAVYAVADAERQVRQDLANAWKTLSTAEAASKLAGEQVSANEVAFQGSIMESQVGARTTIDILNAEQELLQSKISAFTDGENCVAAAYQVLGVLGQMTAKSLKLPVKLYDPQEHYDNDATRWFGFGD